MEVTVPSLDEMFASLAADADLVPPPDLALVEASGRRRRFQQLTTAGIAALVLVLAAGTVLGVGQLRRRALPAPEPAGPGPVQFHELREIGPGVPYPAPAPAHPPAVSTTIADGRGYAVWSLPTGESYAAAIDLATGHAAWGPRRIAGTGQGNTVVVAGGVVATVVYPPTSAGTGTDQDSGGPYAVTALDPATGVELWQAPLDLDHTRPLFFAAALVLADRDGVLTARDWRTGQTRWTIADPSHALAYATAFASAAELTAPAGTPSQFHDPRLLTVGADHRLRVYDVATGRALLTRDAPPGALAFGYEGKLYTVTASADSSALRQVYQSDPFVLGTPRVVYTLTLPTAPREVPITPCGAGLICVLDGAGITAAGSPKLVAVDPVTGDVPWFNAGLPDLRELVPIGTKVLGYADSGVGLYGPDGPQPLSFPDGRGTTVLRVDAGSALTFFAAANEVGLADAEPRATHVNGLAVRSGAADQLGLVDIAPQACSVDTAHLLCPNVTGLRVWRFAG